MSTVYAYGLKDQLESLSVSEKIEIISEVVIHGLSNCLIEKIGQDFIVFEKIENAVIQTLLQEHSNLKHLYSEISLSYGEWDSISHNTDIEVPSSLFLPNMSEKDVRLLANYDEEVDLSATRTYLDFPNSLIKNLSVGSLKSYIELLKTAIIELKEEEPGSETLEVHEIIKAFLEKAVALNLSVIFH